MVITHIFMGEMGDQNLLKLGLIFFVLRGIWPDGLFDMLVVVSCN